ncbi:MAG: phosphoribosylamine--glycine ligase [bacterium]
MKVLIVGSGGREHAIVWKIGRSPRVEKVFCVPGNGGIARNVQCVDIDVTDLKGLARFAEKENIDLTVVGPELPLTLGIVDRFQERGLCVFGPNMLAAEIEGSKGFAKDLMAKYRIPTGEYAIFTHAEEATQYIHDNDPPFVLKADGLAAGKGVLLCDSRGEAFDGIDSIMKNKDFGEAGNRLVIEEFLKGEEASVLAISDGENFVVLPAAQDHKAVFEGDKGPNTGGMGAYAPAPVITPKMLEAVVEKILLPTVRGMKAEGRTYRGVLYAGLMMTSGGPKVLEFNCRFGDPEIQAILPLVETDLVDLMMASIEGRMKDISIKIRDDAAVCVVMASGGYPGSYEKGKVISGLDGVASDVLVFHAGTKKKGDDIVTSGGRVLGVTAVEGDISSAIDKVYKAVGRITFDGAYYRRDIGHRALKRSQSISPRAASLREDEESSV